MHHHLLHTLPSRTSLNPVEAERARFQYQARRGAELADLDAKMKKEHRKSTQELVSPKQLPAVVTATRCERNVSVTRVVRSLFGFESVSNHREDPGSSLSYEFSCYLLEGSREDDMVGTLYSNDRGPRRASTSS